MGLKEDKVMNGPLQPLTAQDDALHKAAGNVFVTSPRDVNFNFNSVDVRCPRLPREFGHGNEDR